MSTYAINHAKFYLMSHNSPNAKKYVLTNVYRPPERFVDELNVFIQEFSSLLNSLQDLNRT